MENIMFVCDRCGKNFSAYEAGSRAEYVTTIDGNHYMENRDCCPECGSTEYEEYHRCVSCERLFYPDSLYGDKICGDCLDRSITIRNMKEYIDEDPHRYAEFMAQKIEQERGKDE